MAGSSILAWLKDVCFGKSLPDDEAAVYREIEALAATVRNNVLLHPDHVFGQTDKASK